MSSPGKNYFVLSELLSSVSVSLYTGGIIATGLIRFSLCHCNHCQWRDASPENNTKKTTGKSYFLTNISNTQAISCSDVI